MAKVKDYVWEKFMNLKIKLLGEPDEQSQLLLKTLQNNITSEVALLAAIENFLMPNYSKEKNEVNWVLLEMSAKNYLGDNVQKPPEHVQEMLKQYVTMFCDVYSRIPNK